MYNSFNERQSVIVNGFGKNNNDFYRDKLATVICKDYYYGDYNVKFEDGTEDWIAEKYLKKAKEVKK